MQGIPRRPPTGSPFPAAACRARAALRAPRAPYFFLNLQ
jgi:hypothetical protein